MLPRPLPSIVVVVDVVVVVVSSRRVALRYLSNSLNDSCRGSRCCTFQANAFIVNSAGWLLIESVGGSLRSLRS